MVDTAEIEHDLTRKLGPLPVWGWGVGIGAILVVMLWLHGRSSSAATTDTSTSTDGADATDSALSNADDLNSAYQSGVDAGSAGAGAGSGSSSTDTGADTTDSGTDSGAVTTRKGPRNNAAWARAAALTFRNPLHASNVLNKYIQGVKLNHQQKKIVKQAIQSTGLPPTVPKHVSTQTHTPKPAATVHHDATVTPHVSNATAGGHPRHHVKVH